MNLKDQLIKLGSQEPHLRNHLERIIESIEKNSVIVQDWPSSLIKEEEKSRKIFKAIDGLRENYHVKMGTPSMLLIYDSLDEDELVARIETPKDLAYVFQDRPDLVRALKDVGMKIER